MPTLAALIGVFATSAPSAGAAAAHHIRPGAGVTIASVHCEAGLLLHKGKTVYVAVPASCAALPLDEGKVQNGCAAASAPVGTPVHVDGAKHRSILVYDSFTRMESMGTKSTHKCYFNDLALVRLNPKDAKSASGTIPGMNAPRGVKQSAPSGGSDVSVGGGSATISAASHGGWVYRLSTKSAKASDVGMSVVQGGRLIGMLTAIPEGMIMKTSAAAYSLHKALKFMHKAPGFKHVKLLRAGQHL